MFHRRTLLWTIILFVLVVVALTCDYNRCTQISHYCINTWPQLLWSSQPLSFCQSLNSTQSLLHQCVRCITCAQISHWCLVCCCVYMTFYCNNILSWLLHISRRLYFGQWLCLSSLLLLQVRHDHGRYTWVNCFAKNNGSALVNNFGLPNVFVLADHSALATCFALGRLLD